MDLRLRAAIARRGTLRRMVRARRSKFLRWLPAAASVMLACGAAVAQTVDPTEASLRILRRAVEVQRDGSHLSLLFALRQLREPDLKPFFNQLLMSAHWQMQVHGALGMGEIDPHRQIDPSMIEKLAPQAQDAVVATALDLHLLPHDRIAGALPSEDMAPMARLVLLAELISPPPDAEALVPPSPSLLNTQLHALTGSEDDHVAGLAACLLAQIGDAAPFGAFQSRVAAIESRRAAELNRWLLDAVRRYRLTACLDWVKHRHGASEPGSDAAYRAVFTWLELQPDTGIEAWNQLLAGQPSYPQRVRCCNLLLAAGVRVPAANYDRLLSNPPNPDEELLVRMVAVGKAMSNDGDVAQALTALFELGHVKTSDWALEAAAKLPPEQARRVYEFLLDRLGDKANGESVSHAVAAAAKLAAIDLDSVLNRLRSAEDDSVVQQAILLGLFEADAAEIGPAAASLRRIGSGRADSLALLLMARHARTLDKADVDQLGKIAAGGGGLSEVLQIQAAWLFLKHTGQADKAMTQLFAKKN